MCVCVSERERVRERGGETQRDRQREIGRERERTVITSNEFIVKPHITNTQWVALRV